MRMDHRKNKNGFLIKDILVIGRITRKVDLVFNIMEMGINMKVDGTIANEQDKEHIGFMREKISIFIVEVNVINLKINKE